MKRKSIGNELSGARSHVGTEGSCWIEKMAAFWLILVIVLYGFGSERPETTFFECPVDGKRVISPETGRWILRQIGIAPRWMPSLNFLFFPVTSRELLRIC